ncbi:acetyltransferase [Rhizobium sullae]|uniref:Acetyltransferase n=1 Tax=Rhizobium sullae TaxID=50338 RepID=A0A2N0DE11_RHISU|nr:acetyltransferase [Rhizobium sullae]PKA44333.1 acetyltransferase [Rhizobium sullae]
MFAKKDIPASELAGYRRFKNKSGRGSRADKERRKTAETRKGTKTNRRGLAKGNAISRAVMPSWR